MRPESVVAASLEAYNDRALEAFCGLFAPEIELCDLETGEVTHRGLADVRARYAALFASSPQLRSHLLHRSVVGHLVSDHELVTGRAGGDVEILISYRVVEGRIARVTSARAPVAGPHVVKAEPRDLDTVVALGRSTYTEHFAHLWSPAGLGGYLAAQFDRATVAAELASDDVVYLLGFAGTARGYAKLRRQRPIPGTTLLGDELQKVYVHGVGRGLGSALIGAVAARAGSRLWLDVLRTNPAARRLYERHGFVVAGEQLFATDLGEQGLVVMMRAPE